MCTVATAFVFVHPSLRVGIMRTSARELFTRGAGRKARAVNTLRGTMASSVSTDAVTQPSVGDLTAFVVEARCRTGLAAIPAPTAAFFVAAGAALAEKLALRRAFRSLKRELPRGLQKARQIRAAGSGQRGPTRPTGARLGSPKPHADPIGGPGLRSLKQPQEGTRTRLSSPKRVTPGSNSRVSKARSGKLHPSG